MKGSNFQSDIFYDLVVSFRGSHQKCSMKKGVLKNLTKFTGKHLCQGILFNKKYFKKIIRKETLAVFQ